MKIYCVSWAFWMCVSIPYSKINPVTEILKSTTIFTFELGPLCWPDDFSTSIVCMITERFISWHIKLPKSRKKAFFNDLWSIGHDQNRIMEAVQDPFHVVNFFMKDVNWNIEELRDEWVTWLKVREWVGEGVTLLYLGSSIYVEYWWGLVLNWSR